MTYCVFEHGALSLDLDLLRVNDLIASHAFLLQTQGERLLKGYMVSSVNEWGADQTRILLITDQALHRVKYNFIKEEVSSARR